MKFHPTDKKIRDVFGARNIYKIPNFQRDYSWEKENFEDFLNDLLVVSKATYDNGSHILKINNDGHLENYFLELS